jgi:hypothetical protein
MTLPDLDSHRKLILAFVDVARHGFEKEVNEILAGESGRTVEPLSVALIIVREKRTVGSGQRSCH